MININKKSWYKLRFSDIEKLLSGSDDENFFFEFKADEETPAKLIKEISAFSNTYGGYIFLGINNDKSIGGCTKWTEQRIHATIHDSITPIPNFDVKKFKPNGKTIFVIKIEEGAMPPYITNNGQIYERVSSGSFPIKDSSKLMQLYNKSFDQLNRIKNKIELDTININEHYPTNLCGYLDLGFNVVCSEPPVLQKNFYTINFEPIAEYIRKYTSKFSISRLASSYLFSLGSLYINDANGNQILPNAGINNFIEIMLDGSVKCRIMLTSNLNDSMVDISSIGFMNYLFKQIYTLIFGNNFANIFVYAHKYERLTVLKQFIPHYVIDSNTTEEDINAFGDYLNTHQKKYGNNIIIDSDRFPKNDYQLIDKRQFNLYKNKFNTENILAKLFFSRYFNLGYIDSPNELS